MKLVIVEDETRIREGIANLVKKHYPELEHVMEAQSGEEGLAVIRENAPEIVITDIRMAPMNGLDMLRILIQDEKRSFKTIILSAYSEFDYAKQAISFGVCEYLLKPVDLAEFDAVMKKVIGDVLIKERAEYAAPLEQILSGLLSGQLGVKQASAFLKAVTSQVYDPIAIKKDVLHYLLSICRVMKETNYAANESLNEIQIVENIDKAVTLNELKEIIFGTINFISDGKKAEGIVILRAKRIVEEYYFKGLTLEELAGKMGLTPEYISAQFVKELGISFSVYIRQFRIQKAKELLINTDLKLYEIAQKIGYSSAKYFSKVFRETEGVLPTDYRMSFRDL